MLRKISVTILAVVLAVCMLPAMPQGEQSHGATEVRGLWLSFVDFDDLGLRNVSEQKFHSKINKLLKEGKKYGIDTVYFHVRAFDDATWKSHTFKACSYLTSKATSSKTAAETYTYDPLGVVISECRSNGVKIEAWMNPYRITKKSFLDPASPFSTNRINRAVDELKAYNLDGIHFDDYFYHSNGSYRTPTQETQYDISVKGKDFSKKPSAAARRSNVNNMVQAVYMNVHKKKGLRLGISPQGNVDNCMSSGCDIKTWMSKPGYVDYIAPQIYWTDQWGSNGKTTMFSDRLALWKKLNKRGVSMIPGLALYQAGKSVSGDRGWSAKGTNLKEQVEKLRAAGCSGFILFRAADLYRSSASKELGNLQAYLNGQQEKTVPQVVKARKLKAKKTMTVKAGKSKKIKVIFVPKNTTARKLKFKSSDKTVATVSKKGVVKGVAKGKVTITVKASGGAKVKVKVKVK